jgi:hypothetical protein
VELAGWRNFKTVEPFFPPWDARPINWRAADVWNAGPRDTAALGDGKMVRDVWRRGVRQPQQKGETIVMLMHRRDGQFSLTDKRNRTAIESAVIERRRRLLEEPERTLEIRSTFLAAGRWTADPG